MTKQKTIKEEILRELKKIELMSIQTSMHKGETFKPEIRRREDFNDSDMIIKTIKKVPDISEAIDLTLEKFAELLKEEIENMAVKKKIYSMATDSYRHINISANSFREELKKVIDKLSGAKSVENKG